MRIQSKEKRNTPDARPTVHLHAWEPDGRRCVKCGLLAYQVTSLVYGCGNSHDRRAADVRRKASKFRKELAD